MNAVCFGFEELELWKKVRVFKQEVCREARSFPVEEKYRLIDQMARSARSVNALVAKGDGRFTYPDQIHYSIQARGSLAGTINHLIDAYDDGYISAERLLEYKVKGKEIERLLNGYINFLRKKRDELKK